MVLVYHLRPASPTDAPAIARVHVAAWGTTYRGYIPDDVIDSRTYARRLSYWTPLLTALHNPSDLPTPPTATVDQRQFVAVAEVAGEVVGFVQGGPNRNPSLSYDGELYTIYLLADYQRQGIGRALFDWARLQLRHVGMQHMVLWVFRDNPSARRFYEALGGQVVAEQAFAFGDIELYETAYLWALSPHHP
jgi:ribosomal protein S18 acetylase RimI-like enzyme